MDNFFLQHYFHLKSFCYFVFFCTTMKRLLILLICFCTVLSAAAQNRPLKDYLTPIPKELTRLREKNNLSQEQLKHCQHFLLSLHQHNLLNPSESKQLQYLKMHVEPSLKPQEYGLRIHIDHIEIIGGDPAAVFYGTRTLLQLIEYALTENTTLPCLIIHDVPDFERRGYMLDISRNKVPKMETLYQIVDLLAAWKINEFQLYIEHTFAYKNHKDAWEGCSPMTANEIRDLDEYCRERFIDLVPNQNSFGHMENWLRHDRYKELAECPTDCATKWGKRSLTSLDPTNPKSFKLMQELYAELLPNFSSQYFNIGCDETVELGLGNSKIIQIIIGIFWNKKITPNPGV